MGKRLQYEPWKHPYDFQKRYPFYSFISFHDELKSICSDK